jgi:hypothetical protein
MTAPSLPTSWPRSDPDPEPAAEPAAESVPTRATRARRQSAPVGLAPWAVLAVLVTLLVAAVSYDAITLSSVHRVRAELPGALTRLSGARSTLSDTRSRIAGTTATRRSREQAATREADQIGATTRRIEASAQTSYFQTLDITTLRTCLTGVSTAVTAIASADLQGAVNSITAASAACGSLDSSDGGLAYPFDFPDPFVLPVGSEYYAFATNSAAGNIQIIQSSDLTQWTTVGDALPHLAAWARPGDTWGPSVLKRGSNYVLYYSTVKGNTGEQCISEAVATQPEGPYDDTSKTPLVCQLNLGGSMDPSPYVAAGGTPYLTWKSQGANGQPATLWSEQLSPSGTALVKGGTPTALLTPSQSWQAGIIEGPDMVVEGGQYLLLYSGNNWKTADYAIGLADCSGPLGPCTDSSDRPLLASGQAFSGPGGPSVFSDTHGNLWLAFHAWLPDRVAYPNSRPLFIVRVTITGGSVQTGW